MVARIKLSPRGKRTVCRREYRVRVAPSIVGYVPITVYDIKAHRTVSIPDAVKDRLGCAGPRDAIAYDSSTGAIIRKLVDECRLTPPIYVYVLVNQH